MGYEANIPYQSGQNKNPYSDTIDELYMRSLDLMNQRPNAVKTMLLSPKKVEQSLDVPFGRGLLKISKAADRDAANTNGSEQADESYSYDKLFPDRNAFDQTEFDTPVQLTLIDAEGELESQYLIKASYRDEHSDFVPALADDVLSDAPDAERRMPQQMARHLIQYMAKQAHSDIS